MGERFLVRRRPGFFRQLPRTVIILGLVSLLNDSASEMITPLLPVFLTVTLGAGPAVVGLVEGVAEATSSLLKLASGWLSDRGWNAKKLVVGGYSVSNVARPLIGLALNWTWVLALRFLDRLGKGLRTSPRDAMIAASVPAEKRGHAFGFHRGMDHAGAMVGPLIAFALLALGMEMHQVFLASVVPGALVVLLLVLGLQPANPQPAPDFPRKRWSELDARLRALIVASGALALASVPEAFLILWATSMALDPIWVPLLWAAAHAVKAAVSVPAGMLSDRIGRLPVVTFGWCARIAVLLLIASVSGGIPLVWALFLAYGAALAVTEGAERALIGDRAPQTQKGTVFGIYHLVGSVMALPGAVLFGAIWQWAGMTIAFITAATLTVLAVMALLTLLR
ncbi:MAG: MFS transporter [Gammaproteobacteria bacterium]|nr:MFS transporter [Gammaproteobacteria bacterium]